MMSQKLYLEAPELGADFHISGLRFRPVEQSVLVCPPDYFLVESAINPHMRGENGDLNVVDKVLARQQWDHMVAALRDAGLEVLEISPVSGLPDMVFTANQSFPFLDQEGGRFVLMSKMGTSERAPEVDHFEAWYQNHGFTTLSMDLSDAESLEGMGDLLWLPNRRLVFAGIGPRTSRTVVERLPETLGCPVAGLELIDPRFYPLDTALVPLSETAAMAYRGAFTERSWQLLERIFDELIEPSEDECAVGFACNALVLPLKEGSGAASRVLIDPLCPRTIDLLQERGHEVIRLDTSEFRKSGGSVFCMTMMMP